MKRYGEISRDACSIWVAGQVRGDATSRTRCEFIRMDRYAADHDVIIIDDIYRLPFRDGDIDIIILSRMLGDITGPAALNDRTCRDTECGGTHSRI